MRQHGVPNFPDPQITSEDGQQRIRLMARTGAASSPAFNAAQRACSGILPSPQNANPARTALQRHERELGLLSFARCMRTHGVNNFPDPNAQAQITREMLAGAGIDVHLSGVIRTAMTCVPASHGAVSRAAVAQAVHGG
jgi:hypothetical protein